MAYNENIVVNPSAEDFTYRRKLTFANAAYEEFSNFPVMVIIDNTADDYVGISAETDLDFRDKNGNSLTWGCKEFNASGKSYFWIKVTSILATDTDYIWVYWGNGVSSVESKSGVCDANTVLMTPMVDYGDTSHVEDWTGVNTLTKKGAAEPASASGDIGLCQDFAGDNDYITAPDSASLQSPTVQNKVTLEALVKFDSFPAVGSYSMLIAKKSQAAYIGIVTTASNTRVTHSLNLNGTQRFCNGSSALSTNTLYYIVGSWDGTTIKTYLNGTLINSNSTYAGPLNFFALDLILGAHSLVPAYPTDGKIYLSKISDTARSANWLKAQDKILRQQDYVSFGAVEAVPDDWTYSNVTVENGSAEVVIFKPRFGDTFNKLWAGWFDYYKAQFAFSGDDDTDYFLLAPDASMEQDLLSGFETDFKDGKLTCKFKFVTEQDEWDSTVIGRACAEIEYDDESKVTFIIPCVKGITYEGRNLLNGWYKEEAICLREL